LGWTVEWSIAPQGCTVTIKVEHELYLL